MKNEECWQLIAESIEAGQQHFAQHFNQSDDEEAVGNYQIEYIQSRLEAGIKEQQVLSDLFDFVLFLEVCVQGFKQVERMLVPALHNLDIRVSVYDIDRLYCLVILQGQQFYHAVIAHPERGAYQAERTILPDLVGLLCIGESVYEDAGYTSNFDKDLAAYKAQRENI